jgi:hypothetical protein
MTLIHVPRPSKSARDPDRPVNALLQTQIDHLHEAERNLPLRYRTEIYFKAIDTEGEAARYIREVTEAIHRAHDDAAAERKKRAAKRKPGLAIAAAAARPSRKRASSRVKVKAKGSKRGRKK